MEKRSPHYLLSEILAQMTTVEAMNLTFSAQDGIRMAGMAKADALDVVRGLSRADFYKSMTTTKDHRVWQDVYRSEWRGKLLQNYALRNDRICVPAAEATNAIPSEKYTLQAFQLALGKPDKVETNGDDKALFYICNDGQVQVLISATNYDAGQVVGALIKDE